MPVGGLGETPAPAAPVPAPVPAAAAQVEDPAAAAAASAAIEARLRGKSGSEDVMLATKRRHRTMLGPASAPGVQIIATKNFGFDLHVLPGGAAEVAPPTFTAGFAEPIGAPGKWRALTEGKQHALHHGAHLRVDGQEYVCELPAARVQPPPRRTAPASAPQLQAGHKPRLWRS